MMNILIVSNNDACRSRMAMEILTSFGRGMKVFTAGVLPGMVFLILFQCDGTKWVSFVPQKACGCGAVLSSALGLCGNTLSGSGRKQERF